MASKFVRVVCILAIVGLTMVSKADAGWFSHFFHAPRDECTPWGSTPVKENCIVILPGSTNGEVGKKETDDKAAGKTFYRCCKKQGITKV